MTQIYNIDVLINSIVDREILKEINGKKIILYDLNPQTKTMMDWLLLHDIYIEGFLLENDRKDYSDIKYMNKRMIYFDELDGSEIILDTFGRNIESLSKKTGCHVCALYNFKNKGVIIYGAGKIGETVYKILSDYNIPVLKFCDRDVNKHGDHLFGVEIISTEALQKKYYDVDVIVAINKDSQTIAAELKNSDVAKNIYYYDFLNQNLILKLPSYEFKLSNFYNLIKRSRNRNLMIYGHADDVEVIIKKFALLDITEIIGIACDDSKPKSKFIDKKCLKDMNLNQSMIVVLKDCEKEAENFIEEFHLDSSHFIIERLNPNKVSSFIRIDYKTCYDPNIGFNINNGFVNLSTKNKNHLKQIGIIGNSTATTKQWIEKSWSEYLIDEAEKQNIGLNIYAGAVGGQNPSQALIKLIRDMSYLNLDVVIYYSGASLKPCISENYFINGYQKHLFEKLDKARHKGIFYGNGINDYSDYWIHQVRMMYAICKELNIKFYAFLRPTLKNKQYLSNREKELFEHIKNLPSTISITEAVSKKIKEINYPYITDLSDIFNDTTEQIFVDMVHVFDNGNEIIAKQIFEIIKNDLQS